MANQLAIAVVRVSQIPPGGKHSSYGVVSQYGESTSSCATYTVFSRV